MSLVNIVFLDSEAEEASQLKLAALIDEKMVGYLTIDTDVACWVISDIYVAPEFRRQGIATAMLQRLIDILDDGGAYILLEALIPDTDDNETLLSFFKSQDNFIISREDSTVSLTPILRTKSDAYQTIIAKETSHVLPFFSLDPEPIRQFFKLMANSDDVAYFEDLNIASLDRELSMAYLVDDEIRAALFMKKHSDEEYELVFLYSTGGRDALVSIIAQAGRIIEDNYPNATIWYSEANEDVAKLTEGIFGQDVERAGLYTARWSGLPKAEN